MDESNPVDQAKLPVLQQDVDIYLSKKTLALFMSVMAVVMVVVCLVGSFGNIISLIILFNQRMRNQTNYILAALCISDTLFLGHSIIFIAINFYRQSNPLDGEALRSYVYPILGAWSSVVTARITSSLTTLLCVQRFIAVFYPMRAKQLCTKRKTIISIVIIFILTALVFIPFCFKYETTQVMDNSNNTKQIMNKSALYMRNIKFFSVYGTVLNILFRFSPLAIIFILNIIMIIVVRRTCQQRRSMSFNDSESSLRLTSRNGKHCSHTDQHHITIMLITVSTVFFCCILPGAINSIATHINRSYTPLGKYKNLYTCISTSTFFLETINSAVNFIIYMFMSRKFRLLYKEIFCCGHGKYYRKISISSLKEKFRWTSKQGKSGGKQHDSFERKTVSDINPLKNGNYSAGEREWQSDINGECWELQNKHLF
ncbi:hypothetical protein DPMN_015902 [Dreissena polymorpha]|uniref:G-protein coupled receptors family 1 profile domain-containing protein n=1 Tax=Dreissena polymorpha TaxID=45954 RepID=A0A9D4S421_DREPO|nr:hypothetical protein DPMN_015902 [Dreissena polymorpha]